ncbi:MAG: hypothetical protein ACYCQI_07020 [Gammaproteobacteria bacterium]
MFTATPAIQTMKILLQDDEKQTLTDLCHSLTKNLRQECHIVFNQNGEMVLKTLTDIIVGFDQINSFLKQNSIIITTLYYQRLYNIATKFIFIADIIHELKIKKLLDLFRAPAPDIKEVLGILENTNDVISVTRYFLRPKSHRTQLLKSTHSFKDPFVEISSLDYFLTKVLDCPTLLSIYVEALTHPVLGKLLHYLICFKRANITLALPDGAYAVKDFEQLFQLFEIELQKHLAANPVIDFLIDELLNFKKADLNGLDVPDEKISFLTQLIQAVGKRYLSTLRGEAIFLSKKNHHTYKLTFYEVEKQFFTSLQCPANQLAWHKIKKASKDQPLELKGPNPLPNLPHRDYITKWENHSEYEIASLFHKILYEIAYKKAVFPEDLIEQMIKLAGIVAPDRMPPFLPPVGRHFPGSRICKGADQFAIKIGNVALFKTIVERYGKDSPYWKKGEPCLTTVANQASLSADIKIQMILAVAECDPESDTRRVLFSNPLLKDAYVSFVANSMECIRTHLTKDTTSLVQSYLDESVVGLARNELTRRLTARNELTRRLTLFVPKAKAHTNARSQIAEKQTRILTN